ncbi:hypothetical protein TUM4433_28700 [Shewanella schlegeliana]|nr:hypothetical protein TUM4433_28700 [Shewanella schlegeliana]
MTPTTGSVEYASSAKRPKRLRRSLKDDFTLFNNMTSKSVWALTEIKLFEIASNEAIKNLLNE